MNANKHTERKSYSKSTFRVRRMIMEQKHKYNIGTQKDKQTEKDKFTNQSRPAIL
jgi:hypothetical protein